MLWNDFVLVQPQVRMTPFVSIFCCAEDRPVAMVLDWNQVNKMCTRSVIECADLDECGLPRSKRRRQVDGTT